MTGQGAIDLGERGARDAFALHLDLLGADAVLRALDVLETGLRIAFIERQAPEAGELGMRADEAHRLISTATAIGFLDVARACAAFEESCRSGAARNAFERAQSAAAVAVREIGRLRNELQAVICRDGYGPSRPAGQVQRMTA